MNVGEQLISLEKILLSPAIRHCMEQFSALLADDFVEITAKGERLERAQTMSADVYGDHWEVDIHALEHRQISHDTHQLIYQCMIKLPERPIKYTRRTSLWRWNGENWQMVFHQASLCSAADFHQDEGQ